MLRITDKFESTPLNSGLKKSSVGFRYVAVDDDIGSSMGIIGSALNVDIRARMNLDGWLKLIRLNGLIIAFE